MTGAFAESMKFKTFLVLSLLWPTFVYDPLLNFREGVTNNPGQLALISLLIRNAEVT